MAQYSYDETGDIFRYFLLTLMALGLVPMTYWHCSSLWSTGRRGPAIRTKGTTPFFSWRLVALSLGWALFAYLLALAASRAVEEKGVWDPYEILGVSESADNSTVRRAFKKLSLQYHPDKVAPADKAAAELKFVEISKAHKVLTNDEARKVFDETGHPDGRQAFQLGLALPKWLVEEGNSAWVLLFYALTFGVGMPVAVVGMVCLPPPCPFPFSG
jgi:translocation protein SEC63